MRLRTMKPKPRALRSLTVALARWKRHAYLENLGHSGGTITAKLEIAEMKHLQRLVHLPHTSRCKTHTQTTSHTTFCRVDGVSEAGREQQHVIVSARSCKRRASHFQCFGHSADTLDTHFGLGKVQCYQRRVHLCRVVRFRQSRSKSHTTHNTVRHALTLRASATARAPVGPIPFSLRSRRCRVLLT